MDPLSLPSSSKFLFFFLLSLILLQCSSGCDAKDIRQKSGKRGRQLIQTTQHDFTDSPLATYPTTPVTNPVTTPATNPGTTTTTPPMITVPSADPTPTFNPPADPTPTFNPPAVPVSNPVPSADPTPTFNIPPAVPVTTPSPVGGQSWCVARDGLPESTIQVALDYACGIGGADCSAIQQGQSCYNPNSLQYHASYAFNSYFQRNPVQTSCDFGGAATLTNVNPSTGSCIFTTWSSSPATVTTAPAAQGGSGTPPTVMNASNPALGGGGTDFGEVPPTAGTTSVSSRLKPFISCIIVVVSIIVGWSGSRRI